MVAQEEIDAWDTYLWACLSATPEMYEAVETWAWDQLLARLYELEQAKEPNDR